MTDVTKARAAQIDSLRTFAVLGVVFSHTITERYAIGDFLFFEFGAYGVNLFFVISAFLITSQLQSIKDDWRARGDSIAAPLRSFYAKRALRLLPAYYLLLLAVVAIDLGSVREEALWHALMVTNVLFGLSPLHENISPVGHLWSLAMEWQFYIVWPWLVLLLSERKLLFVTLAMLAAAVADHAGILPIPAAVQRMSIINSLDSLAFGALLAIGIRRDWQLERYLWLGWPAAAVMAAGLSIYMLGFQKLGDRLEFITHEAMNFVFAVIVFSASRGVDGKIGRVLDNAVLQYLGLISYGIYLYHQLLIELYWRGFELWLGRTLPIDWGIGLTVLIFPLATAAAAASWHFFEAPINRFRHRFDYRAPRSPAVVTDAAVLEQVPDAAASREGLARH